MILRAAFVERHNVAGVVISGLRLCWRDDEGKTFDSIGGVVPKHITDEMVVEYRGEPPQRRLPGT